MATLKASPRAVCDALHAAGLDGEIREFPASTRTAKEAAAAIGCDVAAIAKTIVFRAQESGRAVLVVASGTNRIDEARVSTALGETIGRATPEFVRKTTGFAIGGVPPCGHVTEPVAFIDQDLLAIPNIWAAAGTPNAVFRLTPGDLQTLTGGTVIQVAGS